jgi:hypothetical protein
MALTLSAPRREHRAFRVSQDVIRCRAEHGLIDPIPSMRTDHDQIDVLRLGH